MTEPTNPAMQTVLVDESLEFTLIDLSHACDAHPDQLIALVHESVLSPWGPGPDQWRFDGTALARAGAALRLVRDLHLNMAGVALALDLIDEINALKARLHRLGVR